MRTYGTKWAYPKDEPWPAFWRVVKRLQLPIIFFLVILLLFLSIKWMNMSKFGSVCSDLLRVARVCWGLLGFAGVCRGLLGFAVFAVFAGVCSICSLVAAG